MSSYQLTLPLVDPGNVTPQQGEFLQRGRRAAQGLLPNMYRAMVNSPPVLDAYLHGYVALRRDSALSPAELEVAFLVISYENGCDYCVAAHSLVADTTSRVSRAVTDAIRAGRAIPDRKLAALADTARAMLLSRGRIDEDTVRRFLDAGYEERHLLDIVLVISVKTLSNYTNHLFQTPLDAVFKVREFGAFKATQHLFEFFSPRNSPG